MNAGKKPWYFIRICFMILNTVFKSKSYMFDGNVLRIKLDNILEKDLRTNEIQDHFDDLSYTYHPLDGHELISEISGSLNRRILEGTNALQIIKEAAESHVTGFTSSENLQQCSKVSYGNGFEGKISKNIACVLSPRVISESMVHVYPSMRVIEVMKENSKKNEYFKRHLIATDEGVMTIYPSPGVEIPYDFHQKYRQIYSSKVSPADKDVVLVIDRSGSMAALHGSKTLLQIAIDAVSAVLDTLSLNDRVGIVVFDTATAVPGTAIRKCFATKLAEATPANVRLFQNIIQQIQSGARTNYELALREAFKFFRNSNYTTGSEKRDQIILFLTDGLPTIGNDPVRTIAEENKHLNNSVVVFTYGIGRSLNTTALTILRHMAEQAESDPRQGDIHKGIFEHIADPSNLRNIMGSYYKRFRKTDQEFSLSLPYYDRSLSGFISSLCKDIHNSHYALFGVACIDMKLTNLLEEVAFFQHGQNSYAFVIDGKGRTVIHPALPKRTMSSDFVIEDIGNLEKGVSSVIESMKRGESGTKKIYATRVFSRGQVFIDGIYQRKMWSTYHWKPILQTNFSLCVVTVDGDGQLKYNTSSPFPERLHYHGLDTMTHFWKPCNHFSRYATKEHSTVFLTPAAFVNPDVYLEKEEIGVMSYIDYLSGKSSYNPGLKTTILESVRKTYIAEELWLRFPQHSSIWRYMGMSDGVLRVFPGLKIPKNYDHTQRSWYKRSLAMRGQTVVTGPYLDVWGGGYVITLSTTIQSSTLKNTTFVIGVMAVDVSLTYFYQLLIQSYPFCEMSTRCFVMDNSGIITLHDDFVNISTRVPIVDNIHITQKESRIAQHMLRRGLINKESCLDIFRMRQHYVFRVRLSFDPPVQNIHSSQPHYKMFPISNSNIYVVVKPRSLSVSSSYSQCCENLNDSAFPADHICTEFDCQCLCFEEMSFDNCADHLNAWRYGLCSSKITGNISQCVGSHSVIEIESHPQNGRVDELQLCFDPKCAEKHSRRDCINTTGCSWCTRSIDFELLLPAYCTLQENCYFGIEGYVLPVQCTQGTSCKFESDRGQQSFCGWHNSINDNLDWKLISGPTPSKYTGPQNDHTLGTSAGHYLYVESSNPASPQDKALLESSKYYQSGPNCNLTFWYNMNGREIGTLQVLLKTSISNQLLRLWQKTGSQGPDWKQASIPISSNSQFAIIFEAKTGFGYLGDIAIDDINYSGCDTGQPIESCRPTQFLCANQLMCIERRYRCDEKVDCQDGSDEDNCRPFNGDCNFETTLSQCQWKQSIGDDGDWMVAHTTVNGPKRDHRNTATGHFIYMDSSLQSPGDGVRVQTPFFPASHGVCYMRFWYFMFGSPGMGPLKVFLQNRNANTTDLVWEMVGSQGAQWKYVNIPVGSAQDFSVIFEATRGDQDHSDIAIDDVSFTPECGTGAPPTAPSHKVCYQGKFFCAPKDVCFPNSWKCDGVQDCPDGSDEPSTCPTTPPVTGTVSSRASKSLPVTSSPPPTTTHKIKTSCAESKFQCNDDTCIPLLLLCDAVADCPDGSDETPSNCPIQKCDVGFYYCKQQRQCINGTRCDNIDDCGDKTDESVCGNACPPNFCQSGSVCQKSGVQTLSCSCPKGLHGIRCQYRETSVLRHSSNSPASSSGWKAGVGVAVALVCIVGIFIAGYFLWRRQKQRNFNQRLGIGLENPSYDGGDMHDFQMEDSFHGVKMTSDSTSIENPLYQDATT